MMGTEILKIDAEMAEKIEVEVGNPHLKIMIDDVILKNYGAKCRYIIYQAYYIASISFPLCNI